MSKPRNGRDDAPLRDTEIAAYHAFREWPIWLVLRLKQLQAHTSTTVSAKPAVNSSATKEPA